MPRILGHLTSIRPGNALVARQTGRVLSSFCSARAPGCCRPSTTEGGPAMNTMDGPAPFGAASGTRHRSGLQHRDDGYPHLRLVLLHLPVLHGGDRRVHHGRATGDSRARLGSASCAGSTAWRSSSSWWLSRPTSCRPSPAAVYHHSRLLYSAKPCLLRGVASLELLAIAYTTNANRLYMCAILDI